MLKGKLIIDGQEVPLTWEYALRFSGFPLEPVLYRNGKRVTKAWTLELKAYQIADSDGGNANTD